MLEDLILWVLYRASWPIRPYEEGWSGVIEIRDYFGIPGTGEIIKNSSWAAQYFYSY